MKVSVTLHDLTVEESGKAISAVAAALGAVTVSQVVQRDTPAQPAPPPPAAAPIGIPGPGAAAAQPAPQPAAASGGVTMEDVKKAFSDCAGRKKATGAVAILKSFNINKVGEAPAEQWPALIAAFNAP